MHYRCIIYNYSESNTMTVVKLDSYATFSTILRAKVTNEVLRALTNNDLVVNITAYGISNAVARSTNT